jgi:hypothetical protein
MREKLYRKRGNRYESVGWEWCGWPADGVWYVGDGRSSLIMRVGDMPDPMPLAQLERYRDLAANAMREHYEAVVRQTLKRERDGTVSIVTPPLGDMVDAFFKAVAKAEGARRINKKRKALKLSVYDPDDPPPRAS